MCSFNCHFGLLQNRQLAPMCSTMGFRYDRRLLQRSVRLSQYFSRRSLIFAAIYSHADKTGEKFFHIALPLFFGIVGFIIALATNVTAARYVSLFLMAQSYAGFIVFYSWLRCVMSCLLWGWRRKY